MKENGIFFSSIIQIKEKVEHLAMLRNLIEQGTIKSIVDRNYSMEKIVDAHEYVDKGHKKGNVVIKI